MNILQKIFKEHYEEIEYTLHPRPIVMENIEKMINCGDPSYGGAMYGCSHCGELKFVPFRCHSKLCPACGNKYCIDRSTKMSFKLIDCTHRHLVFTIDEDLRPFFLRDRLLLGCLFQAVCSVILRMFHALNKSRNFVPGFICVLHTFGRPLEWNPHIHCLLTEGGFSDDGFWRVVKHFNYTYLRKAFQTALLNELEKRIGPSFKKTKASIYKKDKNGFYVYAKPNLCDTDAVVKYISRYLGRPVIASSRIDSYDGENVTFHYNKHEDNSYVEKTVPVMDFISLLIQHIPEKHFKMTRYYGLYARHRKSDGKLRSAVPKSRHRILLDFNKWRQLFLLSLVTTLFNVQSVTTKWSFWNSTTIISLFLFLNYTKGQWQNIIAAPVADVLDFIFRLSHTENINRLEAYNGFKIRRGTQAKIYQKSSGRHDSCAG